MHVWEQVSLIDRSRSLSHSAVMAAHLLVHPQLHPGSFPSHNLDFLQILARSNLNQKIAGDDTDCVHVVYECLYIDFSFPVIMGFRIVWRWYCSFRNLDKPLSWFWGTRICYLRWSNRNLDTVAFNTLSRLLRWQVLRSAWVPWVVYDDKQFIHVEDTFCCCAHLPVLLTIWWRDTKQSGKCSGKLTKLGSCSSAEVAEMGRLTY